MLIFLFYIFSLFFFFNDTATTEIYTLSLHDALPNCRQSSSASDPKPAYPKPSNAIGASRFLSARTLYPPAMRPIVKDIFGVSNPKDGPENGRGVAPPPLTNARRHGD